MGLPRSRTATCGPPSYPFHFDDPLHGIEVRPVAVTGLDRVPLAGTILEPPTPYRDVRAVLGMPGAILGLDHPETPLRLQAEAVGVVVHGHNLWRGRYHRPAGPVELGSAARLRARQRTGVAVHANQR